MKNKSSRGVWLAAGIILMLALVLGIGICGRYMQRELMQSNEQSAMNCAMLIAHNFSITDNEVKYMKTLDFNGMETDPINQRLADVATGIQFAEPVISVYVVAPLVADEIKYVLDETNADFWNVSPGASLDAIWLLNMAVDEQGQAVFYERDDIYRYTVTTEELAYGFDKKVPFGVHTEDEWGDVITGYVPLYSVEDTYVGMLGVDFDLAAYSQAINRSMVVMGLVVGGTLICFGSLFMFVYRRYVKAHQAELANRQQAEALQGMEMAYNVEQEANKAKSTFLSTMSHDMRTPLNAIINIAALAHDDLDDRNKLTDDLEKIELSGSFLLGLINDVLDMNKIESGKMTLNPSVYHYSDFINYVDGIIAPLCRDKDIQFIWHKGSTNEDLWIDKTRFNQLFFNLLSNAVKYTDVGGRVAFSMNNGHVENGMLSSDFVIADNGIGMSETFQKHMFEPFERASDVNAYTGTGLGLTITKQIVDLMGGTISVQSKLGEGTTITVHLEMKIATAEQSAAAARRAVNLTDSAKVDGMNTGRILVVEDHPMNREVIERLLKKEHYQTESVENGQEAVDKIRDCEPWYYQAILMDLRMPVMDGLTATKVIRALDSDYAREVPIIAMTANAYDEDAEESIMAGMNAHLSKPVEPAKLYQTLAMFARKNIKQ